MADEQLPRVDGAPLLTTLNVERAVHGDAAALQAVVERFTPLLLAQARHRMGDRLLREADPEDIVSDVWVRVLPRLPEFAEREGRRTPVLLKFLSTATLNRINNLIVRSLRRGQVQEDDPESSRPVYDITASVTNAVTACARGELSQRLLTLIEALPEVDRAILILRGIEQRPNAEAAELLGIEPNTAAVRYRRALDKLRGTLPASMLDEI